MSIPEHIDPLIKKYSGKGVLVDTNLLILLLVGYIDTDFITRCARTNSYEVDDFYALVKLLNQFSKFTTTPNILTEVNNLANKIKGKYKDDFNNFFSEYIQNTIEKYVISKKIIANRDILKLGIADGSLLELANNKHLIITDDLPLTKYAEKHNIDIINFNYIRQYLYQLADK